MKHHIRLVLLLFSPLLSAQQLSLPRIDQMPDFPQPYEMRNWKQVALAYDSLVYDVTATGEHLPLVELFSQTVNYPAHSSFGLHSYVGTQSPLSGEAINVLPSLIGATLCGIDKSDQFGRNWVLYSEEFFNKATGEDVYLNNPEGASGSDWWYETMPNVFFYQLNALYPHTGDFDYQFVRVADRWLEAVRTMGGSSTPWAVPEMGYRAWSLGLMEPLASGVPEPEAAGALAWILYSAYQATGNSAYRMGAEWCMEYLDGLDSNPSYELQLPYGVYAAARMNAELGASYDVEKMLNWCFDVGPLRSWGAIVGNWGGLDCSGLIGEQSDGGVGYAFNMNGLQQAAALLPLLRYDERFAKALGKWILNLANASRLYYSAYLPDENQDGEDWTSVYDPGSLIGYEALKQSKNGASPFATGDAIGGGWSATNLALYGSSHVGMLGGLIKKTNIEGILQTDLLRSDYYRKEAYPGYLYYNPYATNKQVVLGLGSGTYDIYESSTNAMLATGQSGDYLLTIGAKQAMVIVLLPAGSDLEYRLNQTLAGGVVIDFNNGAVVDNFPPRIKALATHDSIVVKNTWHLIYCSAEDRDGDALQYSWSGIAGPWTGESSLLWQAPEASGHYEVKCLVKDSGGAMDSLDIRIRVVDRILAPPVIESLRVDERKLHPGTQTTAYCTATDSNNDTLSYLWTASGGTISGEGSQVEWTAPLSEGDHSIRCQVTNKDLLLARDSLTMMVRDSGYSQDGRAVASYQMNGSAFDHTGYHNHGVPQNITWSTDPFGVAGFAAGFNGDNSVITVAARDHLNFVDGMSLTGWVKPSMGVSEEQFIVSHGSWQNRWKLSISNNRLRFTIKGSSGIADLDSEVQLQKDSWQHFAAVYNGRDMEVYLDASLDAFKPWTGTINTSSIALTIGQMLPGEAAYNYAGLLDDLRIFNYGIDQETVRKIYNNEISGLPLEETGPSFRVFPNPAGKFVNISPGDGDPMPDEVRILNLLGEVIWATKTPEESMEGRVIRISTDRFEPGILVICLVNQGELRTQKLIIH